jgi:hypothetical protein
MQVWYWEKLRLTNIDATLDYSESPIPLIQYWTEEKARKADRINELYNFRAGTVRHLSNLALNILLPPIGNNCR